MNRRTFVESVGVAAVAYPLRLRAQQERVRRVGVLMNLAQNDLQAKVQIDAFIGGLKEAGWTPGRNVQIDYRWTEGDADRVRRYGAELVALAPDVILTVGGSHVGPLERITHTVPIVFVQVADPVGGGFVESLARPGGNATGFTVFEFDISAKWLELLKQIAPSMTRVAVLRDPANPSGTGLFGGVQAVASTFGVEAQPIGLRDAGVIERGVAGFAQEPGGGLVVTPSSLAIVYRELIVELAARHRLPAIYPFGFFVSDGGLISYGPDVVDQYRRAAGYVDRILRNGKPADLPVQRSTKFDLMINLKTAQALGLSVPQPLVMRASQVIK